MSPSVLLACLILSLFFVDQANAYQQAGSSVRAITSPEGSKPIRALQDPKGDVVLVADSDSGPVCFQSTNYGETFSKPIRLVDEASMKPGLEFHVWDAVMTADNQLLVALGNNAWKLNLPKDQWGLFLATVDLGKRRLVSFRNINHKPSEGFSLAVNDQGTVAACWLADKLYVNLSRDHGATFGDSIAIEASINPCNCCTTASVLLGENQLAILYREETDNQRDMYIAKIDIETLKADKKRISKTPWKIDTCPMTYYSLSHSADGLLAAWPTQRTVYVERLNPSGEVSPPGEIQTIGMSGMRTGLTTLEDNQKNTLVLWNSDNQLGWQVLDRNLKPTGQAGSIETAGKGAAGFLDGKRNFVVIH